MSVKPKPPPQDQKPRKMVSNPAPKAVTPSDRSSQNGKIPPILTKKPVLTGSKIPAKPQPPARPSRPEPLGMMPLNTLSIVKRFQALPQRLLPRLVYQNFNNVVALKNSNVPLTVPIDVSTLELASETDHKLDTTANLLWSYLYLLSKSKVNPLQRIPISPLADNFFTLSHIFNIFLTRETYGEQSRIYGAVIHGDMFSHPFDPTLQKEILRTTAHTTTRARKQFSNAHFEGLVRIHTAFTRYLKNHANQGARQLAQNLDQHPLLERVQKTSSSTDSFDLPTDHINHESGQTWSAHSQFTEDNSLGMPTDQYVVHGYPVDMIKPAWRYLLQMVFHQYAGGRPVFEILADFRLMAEFLINPFQNETAATLNLLTSCLAMTMNEYPILFRDRTIKEQSFNQLAKPSLLTARLFNGSEKVAQLATETLSLPALTQLAYPKTDATEPLFTVTLITRNTLLEQTLSSMMQKYFDSLNSEINQLLKQK